MKIYTKTGDKGQTSLSNGKRVDKSDPKIEIYGEIDELNCAIGIAIAQNQKSKIKNQNYNSDFKIELIKIQKDLFKIGSSVSGFSTGRYALDATRFEKRIKEFEKLIDEMTKEIPKLNNFILPGGGETGSRLHLARAICRRAERGVVRLKQKIEVDEIMIAYLNRLSDLLFTMARFINYKENKKEIIWQNK